MGVGVGVEGGVKGKHQETWVSVVNVEASFSALKELLAKTIVHLPDPSGHGKKTASFSGWLSSKGKKGNWALHESKDPATKAILPHGRASSKLDTCALSLQL